ncbi:hypothetical protein BD309DRAFT_288378 [Dichomitus squalens]|nr:hypothetical protein BD309DRAFT_288378 [Dichomitus squalens]
MMLCFVLTLASYSTVSPLAYPRCLYHVPESGLLSITDLLCCLFPRGYICVRRRSCNFRVLRICVTSSSPEKYIALRLLGACRGRHTPHSMALDDVYGPSDILVPGGIDLWHIVSHRESIAIRATGGGRCRIKVGHGCLDAAQVTMPL